MRAIYFLIFMLSTACGVKEASVSKKPFPEEEKQSFSIQTFSTEKTFNADTWLLWKNMEHISDVLIISKKLEHLKTNIAKLRREAAAINKTKMHYMIEQMGADNYEVLQGLNAQLAHAHSKIQKLEKFLEQEMNKPESERNQAKIKRIKKRISYEINKTGAIKKEKAKILNQFLTDEDQQFLSNLDTKIHRLRVRLKAMANKTGWYLGCRGERPEEEVKGQCLANLVDLNLKPPQLILKLANNTMDITLIGFENKDGDLCSTVTGSIPEDQIKMDLKEGKLKFTVICKQREELPQSHVDSYTLELEKTSHEPYVLQGTLIRCTDKLPERGKCSKGLRFGTLKFTL